MNPTLLHGSVKRLAITLITAALLLTTMLAAMGSGPDEPRASNLNNDWEIFEGHVYADNRAAPSGISVVACLGGCDVGYASPPAVTGWDGIYRVKVAPGQSLPEGRMVTFWLVKGSERVESAQDVLFRGDGETRVLDLNFESLPIEPVNIVVNSPGAGATAQSPASPTSATTPLSVPAAEQAGLTPAESPRTYVNSVRYAGTPLLPGFVILLGLLLAAIGASMLVYRRRVAW